MGTVIIAVATLEFFVDRRRINKSGKNISLVLDVLIICLLVLIVIGVFIGLYNKQSYNTGSLAFLIHPVMKTPWALDLHVQFCYNQIYKRMTKE